jgi:transcriptional regulator with XRE-family HTH domain
MSINERIKTLRKALKLTQTEFGERVAIAQGHLTNIETGKREVTDKNVKIICLEFNVSENWLRNGEGDMFNNLSREDEIVIWASKLTRKDCNNEFAKNFARVLSRLDDSDWDVLEKMAHMMIEENKKG